MPLPLPEMDKLKKNLIAAPYDGKSVRLRVVAEDDAAFILALRLDANKGKYMSATTPDLQKQKEYNTRSLARADEFYFIIESLGGDKLGTVRIYDIQGDSFCWGSWIIKDNAPFNASIESALLIYELAFTQMGFAQSHFDVRKQNEKVTAFHQKMGATIVREDELDFHFIYPRTAYQSIRPRYTRFLPPALSFAAQKKDARA